MCVFERDSFAPTHLCSPFPKCRAPVAQAETRAQELLTFFAAASSLPVEFSAGLEPTHGLCKGKQMEYKQHMVELIYSNLL